MRPKLWLGAVPLSAAAAGRTPDCLMAAHYRFTIYLILSTRV